jgi:hypothetical protein
MPVVTDPIEFAARQFLRARDRFLQHSGIAGLDAYAEAGDQLYALFAQGWQRTDHDLFLAFDHFRQSLIDQQKPTSNELRNFFRR